MKIIEASLRALALVGLVVLANGCGSDESDCEKAAAAICAAACDCGGSNGCAIGDSSSTISFDDEADCLALHTLACSQPAADSFDFGACISALDNPTCVQASSGMALQSPEACEAD